MSKYNKNTTIFSTYNFSNTSDKTKQTSDILLKEAIFINNLEASKNPSSIPHIESKQSVNSASNLTEQLQLKQDAESINNTNSVSGIKEAVESSHNSHNYSPTYNMLMPHQLENLNLKQGEDSPGETNHVFYEMVTNKEIAESFGLSKEMSNLSSFEDNTSLSNLVTKHHPLIDEIDHQDRRHLVESGDQSSNVNDAPVATDTPHNITLSNNLGNLGFKITGQSGDYTGTSVSNAGDVNGDGLDDLVVGAPLNNGVSAIYVIYGGHDLHNLTLSDNLGNLGYKIMSQTSVIGYNVSNAGDINGDGFSDLIDTVYRDNPDDDDAPGAVYVIYGGRDLHNITLSNNLGDFGFKITHQGTVQNQISISDAGDVNGDGLGDLIIGISKDSSSDTDPAAAYVIYGGHDLHNLTLSDNLGSLGFKITDQNNIFYEKHDYSVSSVKDINGDGLSDVIIGVSKGGFDIENSDTTYVIYGGHDLHNLTLSDNLGDLGFKITGEIFGSISDAGDVNGDGLNDLIVGTPFDQYLGAAYVIYGGHDLHDITLSSDMGNLGFKITASIPDLFSNIGRVVSSAGDINGDGFDDLIIGNPGDRYNKTTDLDSAYVIYGGHDLHNFTLSDNLGDLGFKIIGQANTQTGISLSSVGDINGDGFDDLIVGAPHHVSDGSGSAYVIYGKATPISQYVIDDDKSSILTGTLKNDILDGRGGNDTLIGNFGRDILIGGEGEDTFVFDLQNKFGHDVIKDFNVNQDILKFKHVDQTNESSSIDHLLKISEVVKGSDNSISLNIFQDTNHSHIFGDSGDTKIGIINFSNIAYQGGHELTDYINQAHIVVEG